MADIDCEMARRRPRRAQDGQAGLPMLTATWQNATMLVEAPACTRTVFTEITGRETAGSYMYFDDIVVGDAERRARRRYGRARRLRWGVASVVVDQRLELRGSVI
jgi:hypothetical protein